MEPEVNVNDIDANCISVFLREHNRLAKLLKEYLPARFQTVSTMYICHCHQLQIFAEEVGQKVEGFANVTLHFR